MKGYIRFVGGPMHNKHVCCAWDLRQEYQRRMYQSSINADPLFPIRVEEYVYLLQRFRSGRGALFYEYHVDVDKTLHSGEDFYAPLPREIEFILLGWFLREAVGPYLKERYERRSFKGLGLDDD